MMYMHVFDHTPFNPSIITLPELLRVLNKHGKLEQSVIEETEKFIQENSFSSSAPAAVPQTTPGAGDNATNQKRARVVSTD